mgnify:CR=1 FL=1
MILIHNRLVGRYLGYLLSFLAKDAEKRYCVPGAASGTRRVDTQVPRNRWALAYPPRELIDHNNSWLSAFLSQWLDCHSTIFGLQYVSSNLLMGRHASRYESHSRELESNC